MAYRTTQARLERDQALREHILECALQQVAEGGFAALAMGTLALAEWLSRRMTARIAG